MRGVFVAVCLFTANLVMPSKADAGDADTATNLVEEVVVTGSRIKRRDPHSISPIYTLDRAEIEVQGTVETKTLLNGLTQVDAGVGGGTGNAFLGSSRVNLRALGDLRTVNLLNGRRYPHSEVFGAVDLNALPPGIIDRVEVITGGASAVYGSDALAGAVNYVLRDDFSGFEVSTNYGVTDRGDGETHNIDVLWGRDFANGSGNVVVFGNYFDRSLVWERERSFSAKPLTSNDDTGAVEPDGSVVTNAGGISGQIGLDLYTFNPDGTPRLFVDPDDQFNTADVTALRAPMSRTAGTALGHFDFNDTLRGLFEFSYASSEPEQRRDDVFAGFVSVNTDRPDIAPELSALLSDRYDPDGDGIADFVLLRRFTAEQGRAKRLNEREFLRGLLGLEATVGSGWSVSVDYSYSVTEREMRVKNDNSVSRIRQGLLVDPVTGTCFDPSNGCVPVNPFGEGNLSAAAAAFIRLTDTRLDEDIKEHIFSASISGSVVSLRAGDVGLALGIEYRRQDIDSKPSESLRMGDSLYAGGDLPLSGDITVKEVFIETRVPLFAGRSLVEYAGLEAGARYSDYDTLDHGVWTWKLGAEWQTVADLRIRAMRQRAIRAPNAAELFSAQRNAGFFFPFGPLFDGCSASRDPIGNGLQDLCLAQGLSASQLGVFEASFFPTQIVLGANPDLEEEQADTWTAGIAWLPRSLPMSLAVDYFDIDIDNAAGFFGPDQAARFCFLSGRPSNQFCQGLSRGVSGNIEQAVGSFANAAENRSSGWDFVFDANWATDRFGLGGQLDLSVSATRYVEAGLRSSPATPFLDCAGKFGAFCDEFIYMGALPKWRVNTRVSHQSRIGLLSLRWRWTDGMENSENKLRAIENRPPGVLAVPRLDSVSYLDLTYARQISEWLDASIGVVNLTDKGPPFLGNAADSANTDPRTYDTLGRRYFLRLTASW